MKILFVASSGGHLAQLISLRSWWENHDRQWLTFNTEDASSQLHDEVRAWAFHPTTRNVKNALRNTYVAFKLISRLRPDVVISTGAAVAVPAFLVSKLFGIHTCYIEVFDRIDTRTLTGRLCYPISDIFCVQWESQKRLYPESVVIGPTI